ncbi:MAG: DUF4350 domain-containing protein [Gammaproteobacteria bacterium]
MSRTRQLVIGLVALAATGVAVLWLAQYVVAEPYEKQHAPRGEARVNLFLAAHEFLERMGVPEVASPSTHTAALPDPRGGVLFHPGSRVDLDRGAQERWLDWAERGGHLLLGFGSPDMGALALLQGELPGELKGGHLSERLDVRPHTTPLKAPGSEADDSQGGRAGAAEVSDWILDLDPRYSLESERADIDYGLRIQGRQVLISFPHGAGRVTFFTESRIFQHPDIGEGDRAELLWRIVKLHGAPRHVLIVRGVHVPSLPAWVIGQAPYAVLCLVLWLVLFVAARMRRFGPVLEPSDLRRRRVLEHVRASGHYLWKQGRGGLLLDAVRRRLQRDLDRLHPELRGLDNDERHQRMARITDLPEGLIARAMTDADGLNVDSFTTRVRDLEEIRKRL